MAVLKASPTPLNPDQIEQQKGQMQTIGTAAPQAPAQSSQQPGAPNQAQALARQGSGRFTNLQKYVQANQGAGQRIAGNIQGQFNKQAEAVNQGIQGAQQQLQQRVNPLQEQLGEQGSQQIRTAFTDPNAILGNQQNLQQFQNLALQGLGSDIANVQGTESLRQQQLQGRAAELAQTANLANTEQGRYQLLRKALGSPGNTYSQGAQRLDQTLLQLQPNAGSNLRAGLNQAVNQQRQGLTTLEQERTARLNALRGLSGERKTEFQNLLQGGMGADLESNINQRGLSDIEKSSNQRLEAARNEVSKYLPELRQRLASNTLTASDLAKLGLTQGTKLYDTDLARFITQGSKDPNLTTSADINEVNRYNALRQLAGQDQLGGGVFGDVKDVGTFRAFDYDKNALNSEIANRESLYERTQPQNIANDYINRIYSYVNGGGSGMRGRRYFQDELRNLAGMLSNAQRAPDRIAAMNDAINWFTSATGNRGYEDMWRPEFNRLQAQRSRTLSSNPDDIETGGNFNVS